MIEANEYSFDLYKIFIGDYSLMIYVEMMIRVIIILSYTIFMIRWIGKRAVGGLGSADILLIVALGSSVGDAMLYPSIPLAVPMVVITLISALQKLYVYTGVKFESVRKKTHPTVVKMVENGELLTKNFTKDMIDKNEVLMLLREQGIRYLSEVEAAYYEQSGGLSVFKFDNPTFKNSILPESIDSIEMSE